ncbi:MAG: hypothetical protein K0B09_05455 [Bacteroidales bacterium]|nr:hypothetical protein [Bacteroidales bacterium]
MIEALYSLLWIYVLATALRHLPFFRNVPGLSYKTILFIFLLKVMAGAIFILIYTYYYESRTADVYRYFNEGKVMFGALWRDPLDFLRMLTGIGADAPHLQSYYAKMPYWWDPELYPVYNDNRIMIRYNAILNLLSFGKIHVNSVIANFISLAGFVAIYKFALNHIDKSKIAWLKYGIFLFPSLLFWGSGLIKEILLFPLLGFFVYFTDRLIYGQRLKPWQYFGLATIVALFMLLKVYVLLLLLPCLLAFYLSGKTKLRPGLVFLMVIAGAVMLVSITGLLFPQLDPYSILAKRQNFYMRFSVFVSAGSLIHEVLLEPSLASIVSYIPHALFNVLFRPHLLDSFNPIIMMAAMENLLILVMIGLMAYWSVKNKSMDRIVWLGIWFTLVLFVFIGITTQVYGTLVRFKIPALPFLWMAFVDLLPQKRVNTLFSERIKRPLNLLKD